MALSSVSYLGDGSNKLFSITFPYLSKSHVKVLVNGVEDTTFTWVTTGSINTTNTPVAGSIVVIKRETPTAPLVDFVDGSTLTEKLLDMSTAQSLFVAEESNDSITQLMQVDLNDNKFDGLSKAIKNVADPVNPQDVATKSWSETAVTSSVTQAANSAASALASKNASQTSENNAANSAASALASKNASQTSENNAANSAASALASKNASQTSENNAANSAASALASKNASQTSENNALAAAQSASDVYDLFDDRFLGSKGSNPSVDNDGNPLLTGALYFNSTVAEMRVYSGTSWVSAYVPSGAYAPLSGAAFSGLVSEAAGSDIASASTVDLTAATGNTVRITGTTAITAFTMTAGQQMELIAVGALPLTYNATTMNINGGVSYTCTAGDRLSVTKDGAGVVRVNVTKQDGTSVVGSLGYGQTRQNLTSSRAVTTTYYNTTGKPIKIFISVLTTAVGYASMTIGGLGVNGSYSGGAGNPSNFSEIILPGESYSLASALVSSFTWHEIR